MGPRGVAAIMGPLAFSASILAGLWIGNPVSVILSRSIWSMFVGALIGLGVGWAADVVVREHVSRREEAMVASANETGDEEGDAQV